MSSDRELIIDTTIRVGWYADQRRWDDIPGLFADQVLVDYTSLTGGEPATTTPSEIAESWRAALAGLDATQHQITNHFVDIQDDAASAVETAQFQATPCSPTPTANPPGRSAATAGRCNAPTTSGRSTR